MKQKFKAFFKKLFPSFVYFPLFCSLFFLALYVILAFAGFRSGSLVLGELSFYLDLYFDFWDFDVWAIYCIYPLLWGSILLYHSVFAFLWHLILSLLNFVCCKLRALRSKK